ncbi:hypothetical protein HN385_01850 [archaeon]|jgi:hypothetical protein|nr:hypothetical protein [archaeon]MBT3451254.1 hypothetical protein [archaeon]MBT6869432.1 hypothetical protein [archaeon]MBT7192595.1 hypothetical protein [archaeon]MBT7380671.1 hypothetical protein [archaeon]
MTNNIAKLLEHNGFNKVYEFDGLNYLSKNIREFDLVRENVCLIPYKKKDSARTDYCFEVYRKNGFDNKSERDNNPNIKGLESTIEILISQAVAHLDHDGASNPVHYERLNGAMLAYDSLDTNYMIKLKPGHFSSEIKIEFYVQRQ